MLEVRGTFGIDLESRPIALVRGEAFEHDDAPGDVIRSFVREELADEASAAPRSDAPPRARIPLEGGALEGIDFVANETSDLHGPNLGRRRRWTFLRWQKYARAGRAILGA